jgi:hypothetical protein
MATTSLPIPRFLYVAACYNAGDASAYHLLVTSDEEHDPQDDAGSAAIVRLLAQASERRDWFTTEDAYREEVRRTAGRIGEEIQELLRYSLPGMASATGAWLPATTDDSIWGDAPSEQEE